MCGIAGFIGKGTSEDLKGMIGAVSHRGPDDQGIFLQKEVGLAHARLSIIDLSPAGHQPMADENKKIWLTFNGEIYNFKELRQELEKTGKYRFKSQTDTEVIIYAWKEYGEKMFDKLDGMFAFALYDSEKETLILASDRLGKKPLYWSMQNGNLLFGSELKALMAHESFQKELDFDSLDKYLFYEYIPAPQTIFKNTQKLEPATYLIYKNGQIKKQRYWEMNFDPIPISESEAAEKLDMLLSKAVEKRLISDVPLGILLSGGIDSSTIAYYAQKLSPEKVKTFSIGFQEKSFDESPYAKLVADFLKTDHHHAVFTPETVMSLIPSIAEILDEPMADPSILPTHLLSKFARQKVTVALSGDGNDELMAGYNTFQAQALSRLYEKLPFPLRRTAAKILNLVPASEKNFSIEYSLKKFTGDFEGSPVERHHRWMASFSDKERKSIYAPEIQKTMNENKPAALLDDYLADISDASLENKVLYLYLKTYLPNDILVKTDRASMRVGLEVRCPFLDRQIVEFVNSLPYDYKYRGLGGKYILKQLMKNRLPPSIINRPKKGFGIPLTRWLKYELRSLCEELLSPEKIKEQGIFDADAVQRIESEHFAGKKDRRKELWTLMVFQLWFDRWT